jgi:hypothetical protein
VVLKITNKFDDNDITVRVGTSRFVKSLLRIVCNNCITRDEIAKYHSSSSPTSICIAKIMKSNLFPKEGNGLITMP